MYFAYLNQIREYTKCKNHMRNEIYNVNILICYTRNIQPAQNIFLFTRSLFMVSLQHWAYSSVIVRIQNKCRIFRYKSLRQVVKVAIQRLLISVNDRFRDVSMHREVYLHCTHVVNYRFDKMNGYVFFVFDAKISLLANLKAEFYFSCFFPIFLRTLNWHFCYI